MGFFSPGRKKKATEEARGGDGDVGNTEVASTISAPARTTDDAPRQRVSLDRHAALPPVVAPKTITSCITADHQGAWRFQTSTVVVHNPGPAPVLFKVKALRPDDVFVKPNQGAIAAGDDIELTLTFKPPNGVDDERPRPNELAVMSLACDAGHSLPCDPSVEQPPGVFVSRAFDAADPSRVFPARKVTIHFDTGVADTVRAATEAMEAAARRKAAEAVAGAMAAFGAKRRVAETARRFGCVWRAVARTRALARQGYYAEDLASEVRAMEARFESALAAARAENDGLNANLEIIRGVAAREEAECRGLEAELETLGVELEHTRIEADRARAEAHAHEEAAASASAAAGVAADALLSAEKSKTDKRDRILEMVKAEAEGEIARETTRMAAEHAKQRKLFDDVVTKLTERCEASERERRDANARAELASSAAADVTERLNRLHAAVPNVLANIHARWRLGGREGTATARAVFAVWRSAALVAKANIRLDRCVEELVAERSAREEAIRTAKREARAEATRDTSTRLVKLESANDALVNDLRDTRAECGDLRGETRRLSRLRETDSRENARRMQAEMDAIAAREEAKRYAHRRKALEELVVRSPQRPSRRGIELDHSFHSDEDDEPRGMEVKRVPPVSSPSPTRSPGIRGSGDPFMLLSRAKRAAKASSAASAGWGGGNDSNREAAPPSPVASAMLTKRAERGENVRGGGVEEYLRLARAAARRFNEPLVSPPIA